MIPKEPFFNYKYFLNFDTEDSKKLKNGNCISNEVSFSPPYSSLQKGPDTYSAMFESVMKDLGIGSPSEITTININAKIYSVDSVINSVMVFTIEDPSGKNLLWLGKDITNFNYPIGKWNEEKFSFPMTVRSAMDGNNKISIYLWNRGKGKVYLDDLLVTMY